MAIAKLNTPLQIQTSLPPERRQVVSLRYQAELEELALATPRPLLAQELQGRQSGEEAWRRQRGETGSPTATAASEPPALEAQLAAIETATDKTDAAATAVPLASELGENADNLDDVDNADNLDADDGAGNKASDTAADAADPEPAGNPFAALLKP